MARIHTNAPVEYDYGYTTQVASDTTDLDGVTYPIRVVEVPDEAAEFQAARYLAASFYVAVNYGE